MDNSLQMEMISTPLQQVPTADQHPKAAASTRTAPLPAPAASLHAVRRPAMKPGRRTEPTQFKVYRVDPREFRHLVQQLTGAPQLSQATQTPEATTLPIDAVPLTSLPPYHHTVQLQGGDMVSIASAARLNLARPYVLENVPSDPSFYDNVVTCGSGGADQLVSQHSGGTAVPSRQAAGIGSTGEAEFWLSALYPENCTVWSSFPTIISPDAIALTDTTWCNDTTGIL